MCVCRYVSSTKSGVFCENCLFLSTPNSFSVSLYTFLVCALFSPVLLLSVPVFFIVFGSVVIFSHRLKHPSQSNLPLPAAKKRDLYLRMYDVPIICWLQQKRASFRPPPTYGLMICPEKSFSRRTLFPMTACTYSSLVVFCIPPNLTSLCLLFILPQRLCYHSHPRAVVLFI